MKIMLTDEQLQKVKRAEAIIHDGDEQCVGGSIPNGDAPERIAAIKRFLTDTGAEAFDKHTSAGSDLLASRKRGVV